MLILCEGRYRRVRFAADSRGRSKTEEEWSQIEPASVRARLSAYLRYFAENNRFANPDAVKVIREYGLIQWRQGDYRVFTCDRARDLVICGVVKKLRQKAREGAYVSAVNTCNADVEGS